MDIKQQIGGLTEEEVKAALEWIIDLFGTSFPCKRKADKTVRFDSSNWEEGRNG